MFTLRRYSLSNKSHPLVTVWLEEVCNWAQSCNQAGVPVAVLRGHLWFHPNECHKRVPCDFLTEENCWWRICICTILSLILQRISVISLKFDLGVWVILLSDSPQGSLWGTGLLKQLGYFLLYSGTWAETQIPHFSHPCRVIDKRAALSCCP